eukprot:CAMPEP_0204200696 /NCGR_PEP_ID=MMETSP0361-20130328/66918_1 /ASSEMBLY_ACC=CAM_ASM_000343 /TAXON_ID=268821 /ORGANISM="Scrippsiella Hangoei, Strain SHTV-5" /LENGTH=87 /DNA_ID=CAMNT_0051163175 /DNA_START=22 /DNA_END=281 /DNA_ORIENTATION=-
MNASSVGGLAFSAAAGSASLARRAVQEGGFARPGTRASLVPSAGSGGGAASSSSSPAPRGAAGFVACAALGATAALAAVSAARGRRR